MPRKFKDNQGQFGTTPVFMASISTILGAILFLRFGYAVGNAVSYTHLTLPTTVIV